MTSSKAACDREAFASMSSTNVSATSGRTSPSRIRTYVSRPTRSTAVWRWRDRLGRGQRWPRQLDAFWSWSRSLLDGSIRRDENRFPTSSELQAFVVAVKYFGV